MNVEWIRGPQIDKNQHQVSWLDNLEWPHFEVDLRTNASLNHFRLKKLSIEPFKSYRTVYNLINLSSNKVRYRRFFVSAPIKFSFSQFLYYLACAATLILFTEGQGQTVLSLSIYWYCERGSSTSQWKCSCTLRSPRVAIFFCVSPPHPTPHPSQPSTEREKKKFEKYLFYSIKNSQKKK